MRLVDINPHLDAGSLVQRFNPPPRFDDVRFSNYKPNDEFPSQRKARDELQTFANSQSSSSRKPFWKRRQVTEAKPARYLDGGFGVGKTHLLASLWHECTGQKAYVTFEELTAFIGFVGMDAAIAVFENHQLLCIDEFELDDVANTLMVVSFLRGVLSKETRNPMKLAVTSNTLPGSLGEKRFSASEFRREIAAISAYFDELPIDGPDFRASAAPLALHTLSDEQRKHVSQDDFSAVMAHLRRLHPVQYGALLEGVDGVIVEGLVPLPAQDDALLFVQLVDKLYDARIPVQMSGVSPDEVFVSRYRNGGYRKKYGRAISRMTAMAGESVGLLRSADH